MSVHTIKANVWEGSMQCITVQYTRVYILNVRLPTDGYDTVAENKDFFEEASSLSFFCLFNLLQVILSVKWTVWHLNLQPKLTCCIFLVNSKLVFCAHQLLPQERRLCAHPFLEIYREGQIQFMVPLSRQGDFYVPEVRQVERRLSEQEESHSDTDVSGMWAFLLFAFALIQYLQSFWIRKVHIFYIKGNWTTFICIGDYHVSISWWLLNKIKITDIVASVTGVENIIQAWCRGQG